MSDLVAAANLGDAPLDGLGPLLLEQGWGLAVKGYLGRARLLLAGKHAQGASGHAVVEAYTRVMDHIVRALYASARQEYGKRHAILDQRCTVVAQGGYGRGELNPCSDVDLLFLHPYREDPFVDTVREMILNALWDSGLEVGHASRTVRYCVTLAAQDLKVKTALLDARYVVGDEDLYAQFLVALDRDIVRRDAEGFIRLKLAENEVRHRRHGDSVYVVEPHLKEGAGGLRDLHTALWLARVKFKTNRFDNLVQKGVITERQRAETEEATDFLWRVRNSLHFLSGEHQDHLTFEYQERIAADLGFEDQGGFRAVERFMRQFYLHAATVNRFSEEMIGRCVERAQPYGFFQRLGGRLLRKGVRLVGQEVVVGDGRIFREDPTLLIRVFADAQRFCAPLSNQTRRLIRSHVDEIDAGVRSSEAATQAFRDILEWKVGVFETLQEMHKLAVLGAMLPEFGNLLCMPQYELYHLYTVDEHSLRGILALEKLRSGQYKEIAPLHTEVMREVDGVETLFLGMLLHDIGKGQGGDHSNRGAAMIRDIAGRLRLNADDTAQLELLVREHLTMVHLATRRDLRDEKLIVDFARKVGTPDNLKKLYLLTFADMRAVNPEVWNSWHEMLLGDLYRSTLSVFERGEMIERDQAARVQRIKARVTEAIGPAGGPLLQVFLADLPDRYFLSTPEVDIPGHFDLVCRFAQQPLVMHPTHFPEREFSEFTVVTRDCAGLFSKLTGALTANGMNILGARITTGESGTAIDVFRVSHPDKTVGARSNERWERIQNTVRSVLDGEIDVEQLVAVARRPSVLGERIVPRVGTKVEIDNEVSADFTVIDVYTQDRVGVLFAITNALYHLGLSVHLAKITTNLDQVLDVFYVTDATGRKIEDDATLQRIESSVLAALKAIDQARSRGAEGRGGG
jgi:[protein-PII] uridylyltransferase